MPRETSTLIAPQGGGRRGGNGNRGAPCRVGSPGPGWEWGGGEVPVQPSECEPGVAGAGVQRHRGERRKREPNRKEEAEMGVVRERGRKSEEDSGTARRCWGQGTRWAATEASHPKQPTGTGRGSMGSGGKGTMGRAAWEIGSSPLPCLLCRWED